MKNVFKNLTNSFKRSAKIGRLKFNEKKPDIYLVMGIAGGVVATGLACNATLKAKPVVDELKIVEKDIAQHTAPEESSVVDSEGAVVLYSKKEATNILRKEYCTAAFNIGKLYTIPLVIGSASVYGIICSNSIMKKRNTAMIAGYATLSATFNNYRKRVVETYGKDADTALFYGTHIEEVDMKVVNPETGEETIVTTREEVVDNTDDLYTFEFSRETSKAWDDNLDYDRALLSESQNMMNRRFEIEPFITLNDVLDDIGMERVQMGQLVGWFKGGKGDGYIDYRVKEIRKKNLNGDYSSTFMLDFNVDGYILDLIKENK